MPVSQARAFAAARAEAGLPTRRHEYAGAPHAFFNDATTPVCARATADLLAALAAADPPLPGTPGGDAG